MKRAAIPCAILTLMIITACDEAADPYPNDEVLDVPGISIHTEPERRHEVALGDLPAILEDAEGVVQASPTDTPGGPVGDIADICEERVLSTPMTHHALGEWLAYAVYDDTDECVATRQAFPREGPGLPSVVALEAVSATWAESADITGPSEVFDHSGIRYFPPTAVDVRSTEGVYLREEEASDGEADLPVHELVWLEEGVYWRLSGIDESRSGEFNRYNLDQLLSVAEALPIGDN